MGPKIACPMNLSILADSILMDHLLAEDAVQEALAAARHQLPKLKSYHFSIR
jgi:hypothetical protein